jgi:glycosyltransferase involved in cell wall biosynthesis
VLLVPSVWPEPFGLVGVEAAQRGVPAVAFDVGGISEWLIDGVTGRLVTADPPRADAFARAIETTLRDEVAWQRMRVACVQAVDRFAMASHLDALGEVFDEVARPPGRAA